MKRIILSILAVVIIAFSVVAQSLTLSTVENGAQPNNSDYWVSGDYLSTISAYVAVRNNLTTDEKVMCKKTEISVLSGSTNYFCWYQCYTTSVFVGPDPLLITASTTNANSFSGDYDALGHLGISIMRYTFYLQKDHNDSVCINIHFLAGYAGISQYLKDNVKFSEAWPNPASSNVSFSYSLPADLASVSHLVIRNLLGSEVKDISLENSQGKLSFSITDLRPGVYFYSLMINNTAFLTRKLVVR